MLTSLEWGTCTKKTSTGGCSYSFVYSWWGVHKTVTTASGTGHLPPSNVAKIAWPRWREAAAQKMTSTGGCSYSFVYSWWGVHKTVTTASGTLQLPTSNVVKIAWSRWWEVAAQKMTSTGGCIYSVVYSWWGVHKTVTTASGTSHLPPSSVPKIAWSRRREAAAQKMTSTAGCSYSFVYSWWWVWLTPETRKVNRYR